MPEEEERMFSGELSRCSENTWCVYIRALGMIIIIIIIRTHFKQCKISWGFFCVAISFDKSSGCCLWEFISYMTQCITHSSLPFAHWEMIIYNISKILSALDIDNFVDIVVLFLWSLTNHFKIGFVNSSANITG